MGLSGYVEMVVPPTWQSEQGKINPPVDLGVIVCSPPHVHVHVKLDSLQNTREYIVYI